MAKLEEVTRGARVKGVLSETYVEIVDVRWQGTSALNVVYRDPNGKTGDALIFRSQEPLLEVLRGDAAQRPFDVDGGRFRLASEANRIQLAHLFDPLLAVHTSLVRPLPHQITAVYEEMLPRQPLRFLLADDPGAGKTIMAGLLMKELIAREDVKRCLVIAPGSLVEQWQEEMASKFGLQFDIIYNQTIEADLSGNPFLTKDFIIGRLDHLSRNEALQAKLQQSEWDLVIVDEAHKMSCPWFGNERKPTKRWNLGKLVGLRTRHLLLMTATPHNGKEEEYQSFLQLLDQDRFEGKLREGQKVEARDIMRRMVKEDLVTFEGTPLFPERRAYAPMYELTGDEKTLYDAVTNYVSTEMGAAERMQRRGEGKRGAIVGFAMTTLQRRLASSPDAIYHSLRRRRENLEERLAEVKSGKKQASELTNEANLDFTSDEDGVDDEDETDVEREQQEMEAIAHATSAETLHELQREIETLRELEAEANRVRAQRVHGKWKELEGILKNAPELFDANGHRRKVIIFTEHVDTLKYIETRTKSLLGKPESVVTIHGSMKREDRRDVQNRFVNDKDTLVLIATDAAGEGVNLQRAHLMVNYDLPWNPNRLEQRFGRIHRIGQTEVCHMWNLVAKGTREGDVFQRLFAKLENERQALGGRVFDVLGRAIEAKDLRELLIEAIKYGDQPEVRAKLHEVVETKLDRQHLQNLLEERALAHDTMDASRIRKIRDEMERAEARRLQPHFIETFFLKAFRELGGTIHEREGRRYEITNVPTIVRKRGDEVGRGKRLLQRYERITFEKDLVQPAGKVTAEFVCPGHPLLDGVLSLTLERNKDALERGSILIDENDDSTEPRALWFLRSEIRDERTDSAGNHRIVNRQLHFVEMTGKGDHRNAGYAPYLDYRWPQDEGERSAVKSLLTPAWLSSLSEERAIEYASEAILPQFYEENRLRREDIVTRTRNAVIERLTREISHWDRRANELKEQELAGKSRTGLSSGNARRNADELEERKKNRLIELEKEKKLLLRPLVVVSGAIVIPKGLLDKAMGRIPAKPPMFAQDRERVEHLAMQAVMDHERRLGREPRDVHKDNEGYDIESRDPKTGNLWFLEVKGRVEGAETVTVTKNEILTALNKPDRYILAVVRINEQGAATPQYVMKAFQREPDFDATSVNYDLSKVLSRSA